MLKHRNTSHARSSVQLEDKVSTREKDDDGLDSLSRHEYQVRSLLCQLMPSEENLAIIISTSSSMRGIMTKEETLLQYKKLKDPNMSLVQIASLLLSIALTVQQAPECMDHAEAFIMGVSDTVDRLLVSDDARVGSLEGVEMTLLLFKLQMDHAKPSDIILLLERIIKLAQLIDLPQSMTIGQSSTDRSAVESHRHKAAMWKEILMGDELVSLMWGVPRKIRKRFPESPLIDKGEVNDRGYIERLSIIANRILRFLEVYSSEMSSHRLFDAVMKIDHKIWSLAHRLPRTFRDTNWPTFSNAICQFWHLHLTLRTHLPLALHYQEHQHFAFDFITCHTTSDDLVRRYIWLRPQLPPGLMNRVIDLQVFTAVIFLLLASHQTPENDIAHHPVIRDADYSIVDQAVETMEATTSRTGSDCAHRAAKAVRKLKELLPSLVGGQKLAVYFPPTMQIFISRKCFADDEPPPRLPCHIAAGSNGAMSPRKTLNLSGEHQSLSYSLKMLDPSSIDLLETQQWVELRLDGEGGGTISV